MRKNPGWDRRLPERASPPRQRARSASSGSLGGWTIVAVFRPARGHRRDLRPARAGPRPRAVEGPGVRRAAGARARGRRATTPRSASCSSRARRRRAVRDRALPVRGGVHRRRGGGRRAHAGRGSATPPIRRDSRPALGRPPSRGGPEQDLGRTREGDGSTEHGRTRLNSWRRRGILRIDNRVGVHHIFCRAV